MLFIDTHCHLNFDQFDDDRDAVVERARSVGVTRIVVPAVDIDSCADVLRLAEANEGVYAAVGVHPNSTADWQPDDINVLRRLADHPKVVAIGEIGLDYYWDRSPRAVQQSAFAAQMQLAAELDLPVIIHNRESSEDVLELIANSPLCGRERAGVLHSFSAPSDIAERALAFGFYVGFTGPVTFKKADGLRRVVAQIPDDRLLLETDAPLLAPSPYRGKRNEPAYIPHIADRVAAVRNASVAEIAAQTTANAVKLFQL